MRCDAMQHSRSCTVPLNASASRLRRLKQWSLLAVGFFLVPLVGTYWHLCKWLAAEGCVLHRHSAVFVDNNSTRLSGSAPEATLHDHQSLRGLACKGRNGRGGSNNTPYSHGYFIDAGSFLRSPPPGIARLVTMVNDARASGLLLQPQNKNQLRQLLQQQQQQKTSNAAVIVGENSYRFDYAEEYRSPWPFVLPGFRTSGTPDENDVSVSPSSGKTDTGYGFRRNPDKPTGRMSPSESTAPIATYFWMVLNVGLYGWYWHNKVEPSGVALDGNLLGDGETGSDFGRALSGNLAHFEIWHVGLNTMSLLSLGTMLETTSTGSIGLFLWTASFLALTTVGVVALHGIDRRLRWRTQQQEQQQPRRRFPSMVGFSGILFCWSVASTLSLPDRTQTCPIPVLESLCFETHRWGGASNGTFGFGLDFSWAPLVQLAVVQVLLPRVSFTGHLSGLLVGFAWHWGLLPPLEWSQPCISYPVLWALGKQALYRGHGRRGRGDHEWGNPSADDGASGVPGGGRVLGGSSNGGGRTGNRWGSSWASEAQTSESEDQLLALLKYLCGAACLHGAGMVWAYRGIPDRFVLSESVVLSELLLVGLLVLFARSVETSGNRKTNAIHQHHCNPFASVGILGRAYVAFAVVALITDSMTLGGWLATAPLWKPGAPLGGPSPLLGHGFDPGPPPAVLLWAARLGLWVASAGGVCFALERAGEFQTERERGTAGIWTRVLGRTVAEPLASLGRHAAGPHRRLPLVSPASAGVRGASGRRGDPPPDRREIGARRAKFFSARSKGRTSAKPPENAPFGGGEAAGVV
ncbi:unnamed protein product [Pseudo-nitzschia multistriata]|uniref:Peptidase S54 rhomboid domain-containing protein n=1 Tax=Pseudo-nitzschia multistriata TaxID=183589 RepID=A0A448YWG4_9STRA|nr:unnamed protein product [Pseudo-nitzschia multistriata]